VACIGSQGASAKAHEGRDMRRYDPDKPPDPHDWLAGDEQRRIDLVTSYHRRAGVRLPSLRGHATIHVIVENQLAMAQPAVVETLERLQHEGLTRHAAVHAIGSVLLEHLNWLMQQPEVPPEPNTRYFKRLERLTAAGWLAGHLASTDLH
jgi:hypothetical protein